MADSITDNRTNVSTAEATTNYLDLTGSAAGTLDGEVFIEGSNSIGQYTTTTRDGLLYNFGATDVSNNTFYIWINCGVVGLLETKANGGMAIRFTGASTSDFFEVWVGGSDDYPPNVQGGWTMFVVDIEEAHTLADTATTGATGGTKPATSAVQSVGYSAITASTMPRMVDNTWMDQITRLPDATPGIIIQGQSGGTVDWDSQDIFDTLGLAVGTFIPAPGGAWKINTPIQFGIADTEDHGFADTNVTWLWDDNVIVPDGFYGMSALSASGGTCNVDFGVKSGTGDAASGSQGLAIQSAATGPRWFMDFNDTFITAANFYGCSFIHGGDFLLDDAAVSVISSLYIDCSSALISNSEQLRCKIIASDTADGVAFMTTDDLSDVVFCEFTFSDGHGVELTTTLVTPQVSKGNTFTGYGTTTSNDAAIYNNAGGAVVINVTDLGDTPTYRDGTSASTTVNNTVTVQVIVSEVDGTLIENARVYLEAAAGGDLPALDSVTITSSGTTATVTHTTHGMVTGQFVKIRGAVETNYNIIAAITVTTASEYTYTIVATTSPATGTITSTAVIINELTSVAGVADNTGFAYTTDQPVHGHARMSGTSPVFKSGEIVAEISSAGLTQPISLISDE
jgi:hypothetical protein